MSFIALYIIIMFAIIAFIVAVPTLVVILLTINKEVLNKKYKTIHIVMFSFLMPLLFLCIVMVYVHYKQINAFDFKEVINTLNIGVELPSYKIVSHSFDIPGGDDRKDTYELKFSNKNIAELLPQLDSLCLNSPQWEKNNLTYHFRQEYDEYEVWLDLLLNTQDQTAQVILYKW